MGDKKIGDNHADVSLPENTWTDAITVAQNANGVRVRTALVHRIAADGGSTNWAAVFDGVTRKMLSVGRGAENARYDDLANLLIPAGWALQFRSAGGGGNVQASVTWDDLP